MTNKKYQERLIVLFILGVLVLNYPIMHLFGAGSMWFGIPVLFLYIFVCWLVLILLLALLMERRPGGDRDTVNPGHLHR